MDPASPSDAARIVVVRDGKRRTGRLRRGNLPKTPDFVHTFSCRVAAEGAPVGNMARRAAVSYQFSRQSGYVPQRFIKPVPGLLLSFQSAIGNFLGSCSARSCQCSTNHAFAVGSVLKNFSKRSATFRARIRPVPPLPGVFMLPPYGPYRFCPPVPLSFSIR